MVSMPSGLAEIDVEFFFKAADELSHVERIDAETFERRVDGDRFRLDVEVFVEYFLDRVESCHGAILSVLPFQLRYRKRLSPFQLLLRIPLLLPG